MKIELKRISYHNEGTFGVLIDDEGVPFALTVERQWLNNRPSVGSVPGSCIPNGTYTCKRVQSPRFGNTFEVRNVPNRTHILFHKGNLMENSRGCIIVGEQFESLKGKPAVLSSAKGYGEFMARLRGVDEFVLVIT